MTTAHPERVREVEEVVQASKRTLGGGSVPPRPLFESPRSTVIARSMARLIRGITVRAMEHPVDQRRENATDQRRDNEQPDLAQSCASDNECWSESPSRIDRLSRRSLQRYSTRREGAHFHRRIDVPARYWSQGVRQRHQDESEGQRGRDDARDKTRAVAPKPKLNVATPTPKKTRSAVPRNSAKSLRDIDAPCQTREAETLARRVSEQRATNVARCRWPRPCSTRP